MDARFRARLSRGSADAHETVDNYKLAEDLFRERGMVFWLGAALLERAEWLIEIASDDARPLLDEARDIFGSLKARPWLDRPEVAEARLAAVGTHA